MPVAPPEISAVRLTTPGAGWLARVPGRGILAAIGGGIAAGFGALFGGRRLGRAVWKGSVPRREQLSLGTKGKDGVWIREVWPWGQ
jgi:hypothetical protein